MFFNIGTHKNYEILMSYELDEKQIKCYRRYKNFAAFDKCLRDKYPYYIIPKLTEKSALSKLFSNEDFFRKRKTQLNFYLNYLMNHTYISQTEEYQKFISDSDFDETYFNNYESFYKMPETEKLKDSLKNKFFVVYNTYFK